MLILGIDPGTARTGWGVIRKLRTNNSDLKTPAVEYVAHGCIITSKDMEMGKRLMLLRRELKKIILTHKPECVVIERIFFGRNLLTATVVGQAKGVILLTISEQKLPVFEYTGLSAKLLLTGDGRADKKVVQKSVRRLLNRTKKYLPFSAKDHAFDDAADGLAIAIYHSHKLT